MDWNELKANADNFNSEISTLQIENNKVNKNLKEINVYKSELKEKKKSLQTNLRTVKGELIKLSKEVGICLRELRKKKIQYILSNGNLEYYSEDNNAEKSFDKINQKVIDKQKVFKSFTDEKVKLSVEESKTDETVDTFKKIIRDNKDKINALQQAVAKLCMEDVVIEFIKLDKSGKYKMVVEHNIYNLKTKKVITNEKDYFYDGKIWYLCRETKSDKKINNNNKINTLDDLLKEKKLEYGY